jgi:hypothetical protein
MKYRQRGYQDSDREAPREKRPPREDLGGPRQLAMPGRRTVLRCAGCGVILPPGADTSGQCPRCRFELHSCKQCLYFDTGSRFECAKPIAERIPRKDARNDCTFYEARTTVERDTSSGARPADARAAFDSLFKK